jgi:hypothetical protein
MPIKKNVPIVGTDPFSANVSQLPSIPINLCMKMSRSNQLTALLAGCFIVVVLAGCDEQPLKVGVVNWEPQSTGGPIETRPLPPAYQVYSNFQHWLNSETTSKVRLYEIVLSNALSQSNYAVMVQRGDTPMGAGFTTFARFMYHDPTNGDYLLTWSMQGKHQPEFLKLDGHPKTFWLQLRESQDVSTSPRLQIVAIEGVESQGVLVAEPGGKAQ